MRASRYVCVYCPVCAGLAWHEMPSHERAHHLRVEAEFRAKQRAVSPHSGEREHAAREHAAREHAAALAEAGRRILERERALQERERESEHALREREALFSDKERALLEREGAATARVHALERELRERAVADASKRVRERERVQRDVELFFRQEYDRRLGDVMRAHEQRVLEERALAISEYERARKMTVLSHLANAALALKQKVKG